MSDAAFSWPRCGAPDDSGRACTRPAGHVAMGLDRHSWTVEVRAGAPVAPPPPDPRAVAFALAHFGARGVGPATREAARAHGLLAREDFRPTAGGTQRDIR